jgi:hypothetical protein
MSKTWAILPVKAFDRAKTRLSSVLASTQRESVARLMATDVLRALSSTSEIDRILLLGQGPEQEELARRFDCAYENDDPTLGETGAADCLNAGANDLGGTLTNESISCAAGAGHGQEMVPESMNRLIMGIGRSPRQRNMVYGDAPAEQASASFAALPPTAVQNRSARGFRQIDSRLQAS